MINRLGRIALRSAQILLITLVTFGVAELAFRTLSLQPIRGMPVNTWDPDLGTRQIPGTRGFLFTPEYAMELEINSRGLRDREFSYSKPDSCVRILCLGDSFTCGYGVHANETYPKVLERRLAEHQPGVCWEVLNLGVGSTGTAHQLALLEAEALRYDPDLVVLAFFPANDVWDNHLSGLYTLGEEGLTKHRAPLTGGRRLQRLVHDLPGARTLFGRSYFLNFVKYRVTALHYRQLAAQAEDPVAPATRVGEPDPLTRALLVSFDRTCRQRDVSWVLMVLPLDHRGTRSPETTRLMTEAGDRGVACLDLAPCFQRPSPEDFYPIDGHWTEAGHRRAAACLEAFLQQRNLLGAADSTVLSVR